MRPRIIPVLLMDRNNRLVKGRQFANETYVGDPFNVMRIFNEKEVDEICVLDIDATLDGRAPNFEFIENLAAECFMPLTYGGGIRTLDDCRRLFLAGVEKVVIGSAAPDGELVRQVADRFGSQSVTVSIDVARTGCGKQVRTHRSRRPVADDPIAYGSRMVEAGAGEILLNDIDRDGSRSGFDLELISTMSTAMSVPVVALGGAGTHAHLREGLQAGASAVASGSTFVFIGRFRAVLITYPTYEDMGRDIFPASMRVRG